MAGTAKTKTALDLLFATGGAATISAQDELDFIASTLGGYGSILATADAAAQTGVGTSFTELTTWADTDGTSADQCTPDQSANKITITTGAVWICLASISFSGSNNTTFFIRAAVDGVDTAQGLERKLSAGGDVGTGVVIALLFGLTGTEDLTLIVKADGTNKSITVHEGSSMIALRIA